MSKKSIIRGYEPRQIKGNTGESTSCAPGEVTHPWAVLVDAGCKK